MTEYTKEYTDDELELLRRPLAPAYPKNLWDEILPGLFQGGTDDYDTVDYATKRFEDPFITKADFDSVFTLYQYAKPVDWFIKEYRLAVYDADMRDFDPSDLFEMVKIAHQDWKNGKRVLIRCQAGLNRSGLVMALVLMREGYSAVEAITLIRQNRSEHCLFNTHFVRYLLNLDTEIIQN